MGNLTRRASRNAPTRRRTTGQTGFTMVELVMVMVLIGVLSAVVMPKMGMLDGFDEVGYRDQVVAALDFARKSAVAQRRNVQVALDGNSSLSFRVANDVPDGANRNNFAVGASRELLLPGSNYNQIPKPGKVTLTGPATLVFSPLGAASITGALPITYTVTGQPALTVDSGSGYVY